LAVECRVADVEAGAKLRELAASIDDFHSRAAVAAERALLADLEAGCTAPVGALATFDGTSHLQLVAAVVSVDGATAIRRSSSGPAADAEDIGRRLAADLLAAGAGDVIGREHQ
jgi:hydroxymethylbilane synthase